MTPINRRDFAAGREYHICREPFPGEQGPLWYWASLARESVTRPRERGFIDLISGRWRWWDDATFRPWEAGPWHELAGDVETPPVVTQGTAPAASVNDNDPLHTPFTRDCVAAGLTLEPGQSVRLLDGRDLGNRYLRWRGRRYLAFSGTRRLVLQEYMAPWEPLTLAELLTQADGVQSQQAFNQNGGMVKSALLAQAAVVQGPDRAPEMSAAVSRPVQPMTYGVPVVSSGAGRQRSLFR